MKYAFVAAALLIGGVGTAVAQGDAVAQRQAILKTFGAGVRDPGAMMRGEAPFDLAKVKATLATFKTEAPKLGALFPDASLTATGTKALPIIGTERDKFRYFDQAMKRDIPADWYPHIAFQTEDRETFSTDCLLGRPTVAS